MLPPNSALPVHRRFVGFGLQELQAYQVCCGFALPRSEHWFYVLCRYETYDELYDYCYRVAGTVALMSVPVMGVDKAYTVSSRQQVLRTGEQSKRAQSMSSNAVVFKRFVQRPLAWPAPYLTFMHA